MNKLVLGLLISTFSLSSALIGKEGIEAYNKARDNEFITKLIDQEKQEFIDAHLCADLDAESFTMAMPPMTEAQKQTARENLEKQLPKEMHGQIDEILKMRPKEIKIDKQALYTYCIDGKPVGFVRSFTIAGNGMIAQIAVAKEHRHKGFGEKLLRYAVAQLKNGNVHSILLDSLKHNTTAHKLYLKVGFVKTTEIADHIIFTYDVAVH